VRPGLHDRLGSPSAVRRALCSLRVDDRSDAATNVVALARANGSPRRIFLKDDRWDRKKS